MPVLPASLAAVGVFTLFATVTLAFASQLSRSSATVTTLGLLAAILATLPALASGPELLPVGGVAVLVAIAFLLLQGLELQDERQRLEVGSLLLLAASGAVVLATTDNLLALALGLETLSLSVAVITALGRGERTLEAAFKYFVLAAVSLAALIYGIGLYGLATGSFALAAAPPTTPELQFLYGAGLVLVTLGLAFELAVAPLHWGALGAYIAAAPAAAGFIMSLSKLGAVLALSRLAVVAGAPISTVLIAIGLLSIVWGTIAAFAQRDLRMLLGYSAIAHAGFLALALGTGPEGRVAAVFYVVVYAATAMLVFAALAGLGTGPLPMDSLRGAGLGPLRAIALMLGLLSLAGIPPTPGFWAKLAILGPAWTVAGPIPTIIAVICGVAGALYYLRPLPDLFAAVGAAVRAPSAPLGNAAVALAGVAVVVFGLVPGLAYLLAALSQPRI